MYAWGRRTLVIYDIIIMIHTNSLLALLQHK
jgi:hypothetical protein